MTDSMRARIDIGLKLIATCAAIFGIWKYFYDLERATELAKKQEAQQIISTFSSQGMRAARVSLVHFWVKQNGFLRMEALAEGASDRAYLAFATKKLNTGDEALWRDLFVLSSFFDEAWFCRSSDICDPEVLDRFVCGKSMSIGRTYGSFFDAMNVQLRSSEFGRSLNKYRELCGK